MNEQLVLVADAAPVPRGILHPDELIDVLERFRFRYTDENELQQGIAKALTLRGITFEREKVLSRPDRPDFLVCGGVAIEVKIKGSLADLLRQVSRYATHTEVIGVLAVGTPKWLPQVPEELCGKPVRSLRLIGSLL